MTLVVQELICDHCGYRCCAEGIQLCENAQSAGFITREEWERRRVEGGRS